jgi:drug/metabolite transporter (DMT)-like permease
MACAGVLALQAGRKGNGDSASLYGDLLVFLAMMGEAVFITAGRFIKGTVHQRDGSSPCDVSFYGFRWCIDVYAVGIYHLPEV